MVEQAASIPILTVEEKKIILTYLNIRNQCAHPNEHVSTAEEARAVFTGYLDKKREFNCDLCFKKKNIEEKLIYQFDKDGDIVACVDCKKNAFEQSKV
ncbi:hypothetical protein C1N66_30670 [Bacillus cereus]|uniref:Uncharacterized protein n=1 Tax=Bacillus cereus TaxID=1396 RepID=A0AB73UTJ2_BACCE|nr:hypothetical protein [Bacillus cereus]QHV03796.1 hypothetical protein C1N82_10960 [Bacillus cereus]QHV47246.1 hypothetical protein C1N66_30670 [Bacillus cereus]